MREQLHLQCVPAEQIIWIEWIWGSLGLKYSAV